MHILIRNLESGLYFQGPNKWTENPNAAVEFWFTSRALSYARKNCLQDVELAFAFDGDPPQVKGMALERADLQCGGQPA